MKRELAKLNIQHATPRLLCALLICAVVTGCKVEFSLPQKDAMRLTVHTTGQPIYVRDLSESDPARLAVNRWLASHPEGWEYGFITRDPQIYLAGKDFSVNITTNEVLLKYCRAAYSCHYWVKQDGVLFRELRSLAEPKARVGRDS